MPGASAAAFPSAGSHLERYAAVFDAVEINSSFYRPHRRATYERWASSTPAGFVFAVKAPKAATHDLRLRECGDVFSRFLDEAGGLGAKLRVVLVQTPPSLPFDPAARGGLCDLRERTRVAIAFEPRHASWFAPEATRFLDRARIARVGADPAPVEGASSPGGWGGLVYRRWHGAPRVYYSEYGAARCAAIAADLAADRAAGRESWCVFDNTAAFFATADALRTRAFLSRDPA